jgi:hypothetical protein
MQLLEIATIVLHTQAISAWAETETQNNLWLFLSFVFLPMWSPVVNSM